MKEKVSLDSSFFTVYFSGLNEESRHLMERVYSGEYEAYILTTHLGEFLDTYRKVYGLTKTSVKLKLILESPIRVVPLTQEVVEDSIRIREQYPSLSLNDCYLVSSSTRLGSRIVTANPELVKVKQDSILLNV
ncbi:MULTISPECIES: PIN domain-containing protein [Metallosphaera]|uniref:Type II toxin-antitoxin system VapC family toxin n=1 Tax=Metallosphaera prunae TaxID=47304 RepID=A0A4D8RVX9_METPR|nr:MULTISPECIES: PIN domain-containing protein [Metallosphaera]QCO29106.1 type II toxin-antitoxin system VapC family toxin [Metallosphaera prunae]BBL47316.1 PIN domain nuclease [Metallosphaera sedula]